MAVDGADPGDEAAGAEGAGEEEDFKKRAKNGLLGVTALLDERAQLRRLRNALRGGDYERSRGRAMATLLRLAMQSSRLWPTQPAESVVSFTF